LERKKGGQMSAILLSLHVEFQKKEVFFPATLRNHKLDVVMDNTTYLSIALVMLP